MLSVVQKQLGPFKDTVEVWGGVVFTDFYLSAGKHDWRILLQIYEMLPRLDSLLLNYAITD